MLIIAVLLLLLETKIEAGWVVDLRTPTLLLSLMLLYFIIKWHESLEIWWLVHLHLVEHNMLGHIMNSVVLWLIIDSHL